MLTLPSRAQIIREHKERGGRIAAVLPIHYPRALFYAFEVLPVEVWGPPGIDATRGMAHIQPYVCSVVRNALSFLLSDGATDIDLIVAPHTCDSMQGLGSILIDFIQPRQPTLPIYLPRGARAADLNFLAAEFRSLYERLAVLTNRRPTADEMMAHIRRDEMADALLADLHRRRFTLPLSLFDFYRLIRSREYLPVEAFAAAESALAQGNGSARSGGVPVVVSGIVPEPMSLFESLDQMGAVVAADDFASCGRRLYPAGTSAEPFARMAERICAAPPDSTRGSSIHERLAHLQRLAESSGAKGVVFYGVKFCEPELFYLPALRQGLQAAGLPSVSIEVDVNDPLAHQTLTRLEAFLEMIA